MNPVVPDAKRSVKLPLQQPNPAAWPKAQGRLNPDEPR